MTQINVETWNSMYSEGRSLLIWPDENVVTFLNKYYGKFKKGIDIGCGAGRHALLMAQQGIETWGVDSSNAGIEFAIKRAEQMNMENIHFETALAQDLNLEDNSFDLVIAWGLFHYLKKDDQVNLLNIIYRILSPGGFLLCTMRSTKDSRAENSEKMDQNHYLVDYFDKETGTPKKTVMEFWDEHGVRDFLKRFNELSLGHRIVEPIGKLGLKSSHWLISAQK